MLLPSRPVKLAPSAIRNYSLLSEYRRSSNSTRETANEIIKYKLSAIYYKTNRVVNSSVFSYNTCVVFF